MDAVYPLDEASVEDLTLVLTSMLTVSERRRRLGLKLETTPPPQSCSTDSDPSSPSTSNEPLSPDSGFSSDDGAETIKASRKLERSKTLPPSAIRSPHTKRAGKNVRFADALGFDLTKMEFFSSDDDESRPFSCSFPPPAKADNSKPRLTICNFAYRSESESIELARNACVCVAALHVTNLNATGQINVKNLAFTKQILLRYSLDNWKTSDEVAATFSHRIFGADDVDAFNFVIMVPNTLKTGQTCEFCICYTVDGKIFWDNNMGANYKLSYTEGVAPEVEPTKISMPQYPSRPTSRRSHMRRWGKVEMDSDEDVHYSYSQRSWVSKLY